MERFSKDEHRTSNAQHPILNGKDEETDECLMEKDE
jgi:hypothetical protein